MKTGILNIRLVDGEESPCSFHAPERDENHNRIIDKKVIEINYGFSEKLTTTVRICEDCWDTLNIEVEKKLLASYGVQLED